MLYQNVETLVWNESVTVVNHGIYAGRSIKVTLVPGDGSSPLKLKLYRFRIDSDTPVIRGAIASVVARHMHEHLRRDDRVAWTPDAAFTAAGIEVKTGLFGGGMAVLPYDQPIGVYSREGYLMFYRESWKKPIATLRTSTANFYPGLVLFESLMRTVVVPEEKTA